MLRSLVHTPITAARGSWSPLVYLWFNIATMPSLSYTNGQGSYTSSGKGGFKRLIAFLTCCGLCCPCCLCCMIPLCCIACKNKKKLEEIDEIAENQPGSYTGTFWSRLKKLKTVYSLREFTNYWICFVVMANSVQFHNFPEIIWKF